MAKTLVAISEERAELIRQILMELPCVVSNGGYYTVKRSQLITWLLGLYPSKDEIIHHKNRNKLDDRPENLEVMSRSEHSLEHLAEKQANGFNGRHKKSAEWKKSASERMKGNQHARGKHEESDAIKKQRITARLKFEAEHPEVVEKKKAEIWRRRKAGELPMPKNMRAGLETVH